MRCGHFAQRYRGQDEARERNHVCKLDAQEQRIALGSSELDSGPVKRGRRTQDHHRGCQHDAANAQLAVELR